MWLKFLIAGIALIIAGNISKKLAVLDTIGYILVAISVVLLVIGLI